MFQYLVTAENGAETTVKVDNPSVIDAAFEAALKFGDLAQEGSYLVTEPGSCAVMSVDLADITDLSEAA